MKLKLALIALLAISLMAVGCITIESPDTDSGSSFDGGSEITTSGSSDSGDKRDISNLDFYSYIDPTYYIAVEYPIMYSYEQDGQSVVFTSGSSYMYYVLEVLLTSNNGGTYSSLEDVQDDYLSQFSTYGAELLGSASGQIDGFDAIDFAITYTADGEEYVNRYIVGTDGTYFYVLQFIVPSSEYNYELEMIDLIITSFTFGDDSSSTSTSNTGSDNYNAGSSFDSSSTSTSGTSTSSSSSEESAEDCYAKYSPNIDDARDNNALQDPTSGGLYYQYIGLIDSCYSAFENCLAGAAADSDACWNPAPGSGDANTLCIHQENQDTLDCAEVEIACHEAQYKSECGLTSGTTTPTTTTTTSSSDAEDCYEWYDQHFESLRAQHAEQDPYSSSIGFPYDNTEECWPEVGDCNDAAEAAYDSCNANPANSYEACSDQNNVDLLNCVMVSIECGENFHKANCGIN